MFGKKKFQMLFSYYFWYKEFSIKKEQFLRDKSKENEAKIKNRLRHFCREFQELQFKKKINWVTIK